MMAEDGWVPLVASAVGGALIGVIAMQWWRRDRPVRRAGEIAKKIKVYHRKTYCSARVAWIVAELGHGVDKDFEFIEYDPHAASEEEREWYRSHVHPHGTVPALVDDNTGKIMLESVAMCQYLAQLYGRLLPPSGMLADYLDWCTYAAATVHRCLKEIDNQLKLKEDERDADKLSDAFSKADIFVRRLDHQLNNRHYICGSEFTAADIVVGYCVMWASVLKGGKIIFDYANVKSYLARLKARPVFAEVVGSAREWVHCED